MSVGIAPCRERRNLLLKINFDKCPFVVGEFRWTNVTFVQTSFCSLEKSFCQRDNLLLSEMNGSLQWARIRSSLFRRCPSRFMRLEEGSLPYRRFVEVEDLRLGPI